MSKVKCTWSNSTILTDGCRPWFLALPGRVSFSNVPLWKIMIMYQYNFGPELYASYYSNPADSDNDLSIMNTMTYISVACNMAYFTVCWERIPQHFIELHDSKVNKIVNTFNIHSFNISSIKDILWITFCCGTLIRIYIFEAVHNSFKIYTPFKTA